MRDAAGLLLMLLLATLACRTPPAQPPSIPATSGEARAAEPLPQVLIAPADRPPLPYEPGGAMAPVSEAERREILAHQTPVFAPYQPALEPIVIEQHRSVWEHVRDFPLFHTLAYAGLGAIIGNQFDNNSGQGAAIGAGLGFLHDQVEQDAERR